MPSGDGRSPVKQALYAISFVMHMRCHACAYCNFSFVLSNTVSQSYARTLLCFVAQRMLQALKFHVIQLNCLG